MSGGSKAQETHPAVSVRAMKQDDSNEQFRDFLENAPLYVPRDFPGGTNHHPDSPEAPRAITRWCDACDADTTWVKQAMGNPGIGIMYKYRCAKCTEGDVWFWVDGDWVKHDASEDSALTYRAQKIGQHPPWDISTPSELRKELSGNQRRVLQEGADQRQPGVRHRRSRLHAPGGRG